jgi:hypothetical protein
MRTAISVLMVLLTLAALAPAAPGAVVVCSPVDDVGRPFWCDWGYDWDERCYRDEGVRLPVGRVDDKVWRSDLRFSLASEASTSSTAHWLSGRPSAPAGPTSP